MRNKRATLLQQGHTRVNSEAVTRLQLSPLQSARGLALGPALEACIESAARPRARGRAPPKRSLGQRTGSDFKARFRFQGELDLQEQALAPIPPFKSSVRWHSRAA